MKKEHSDHFLTWIVWSALMILCSEFYNVIVVDSFFVVWYFYITIEPFRRWLNE